MATNRRSLFRGFIEGYWRRIFNFAFRMTLDRERAAAVVQETYLRAYVGQENLPEQNLMEAWLLRIAHHVVEQTLPRTPEVSFDMLDDTLRSEATRTDAVRSLSDPQRDFLLWELKQGCMTSVVNCLSPGERAAFVLSTVMKVSDDEGSAILDVTTSAYKVRLSRARKKVADYLAPRCEHVDPRNPCRCPSRIGTAISKGFIPVAGEVQLRKPQEPFGRYGTARGTEDKPLRDIVAIYGNLPSPEDDDQLPVRLIEVMEAGEWDKVREQKRALNR